MTTFRAVRLALDYFASVEGRKEARNLCAIYGAASIPSDVLKGASDAFHDTACRALSAARIEGNQEALLAYLLELWHMSFTVEIKQHRRKVDGGTKSVTLPNTSNLDKINRKIVFGLVVLVLTLVAVLFVLLGNHIVGRA